jgi:hypothetical protein
VWGGNKLTRSSPAVYYRRNKIKGYMKRRKYVEWSTSLETLRRCWPMKRGRVKKTVNLLRLKQVHVPLLLEGDQSAVRSTRGSSCLAACHWVRMDIKLWSLNIVTIACWLQFAVHSNGSSDSVQEGGNSSKSSRWTSGHPDWFHWKTKKKDDIVPGELII